MLLTSVDECEEGSRSVLLNQMRHLLCDARTSQPFKIIITSRPHIPVALHLADINVIELPLVANKLHSDINAFVKTEVGKLPQFSGSLGEEVRQTLIDGAKGMFLWVSLILADLKTSTDTTPQAIRKSLKSLPPDLPGVYMNILRNIRARDHKTALSILQWVVWAIRPLTLQELTIAIAVQPAHTSMSSMQDVMHIDIRQVLRLVFGPMLRVEEDNTVHLVHQSAKDFLSGMNSATEVGLYNHSLVACVASSVNSNMRLAVSCLAYLCFDECEDGPVTGESWWDEGVGQNMEILQHKLPFLNYAATHWSEHARQADQSDRVLCCTFQKLAESLQKINLAYQIFMFSSYRKFRKTAPLQIVSSLGLIAFAEQLLDDGADVNAQGGRYGNALQAATAEGHEAMVRLLSARPNINITAPIITAVVRNCGNGKEVLQVLLSARPDIEITKPIITAAAMNEKCGREVMEMLLSACPDINITELIITAAAGNWRRGKEVMEVLLSARPGIVITELIVTAAAENEDCGRKLMEVLLSARSDIKITDVAVVAITMNFDKELMEMVLFALPDIKITEPIITAAARNRRHGREVMERLLSARPDIEITEPIITAAAMNEKCGKEVMEVLLSARPDIEITELIITSAAMNENHGSEVMEMLLSACPDIEITESIITAAAKNRNCSMEVMEMLLSTRPDIKITESVIIASAMNENSCKKVMEMLLSGRPGIEITELIITAAAANMNGGREVIEVILCAHPDIKITEMAVAAIIVNFDMELIEMLLSASPDIEITEPIVTAAVENRYCGREVIEVLLSTRPDIEITEPIVTAAVKNRYCGREVIEVLLSTRPDIEITEPIITAAAKNEGCGREVMEVLLSSCPEIEINEPIITAAAKNRECGKEVMMVLLSARPDIEISQSIIAVAAVNWSSGKEMMKELLSARLEIDITEPIITASARNVRDGMEAMSILLDRDRSYGTHLASLQAAAYFGMFEYTKSLLTKCSPAALNEQYTQVLHAAVESGVADILELVLEFGGNDSSPDDHNWTTYMTAFQSRNAWALQRFADTAQLPSSSVFPPEKWVSAHACVLFPQQGDGAELLYSGKGRARTLTRKLTWLRYINEYAVLREKRPSLSAWKSRRQLFRSYCS